MKLCHFLENGWNWMLSEISQSHKGKYFCSFVEARGRTDEQTTQTNKNTKVMKVRGTTKVVERERKEGIRKKNGGVNMIKFHCMHVWKCHDETPYYVQFNIYL
jgi:hypothetical protein